MGCTGSRAFILRQRRNMRSFHSYDNPFIDPHIFYSEVGRIFAHLTCSTLTSLTKYRHHHAYIIYTSSIPSFHLALIRLSEEVPTTRSWCNPGWHTRYLRPRGPVLCMKPPGVRLYFVPFQTA